MLRRLSYYLPIICRRGTLETLRWQRDQAVLQMSRALDDLEYNDDATTARSRLYTALTSIHFA